MEYSLNVITLWFSCDLIVFYSMALQSKKAEITMEVGVWVRIIRDICKAPKYMPGRNEGNMESLILFIYVRLI